MLKHASIIITLTTAILYTLGLTFYQGYLFELGVEETQFPLTVDRTLFQGFISITTMGAKAIVYLYLTALCVTIVAMVGNIFLEQIKTHMVAKKIAGLFSSTSEETEIKEGFMSFSLKVAENASYLILFFFFGLVVLVLCEKAGQEAAIEFKQRCERGEIYPVSISLKNSEEVFAGYSIVCSNWQCVYLVNGTAIVLNKSDIRKVVTSNKT